MIEPTVSLRDGESLADYAIRVTRELEAARAEVVQLRRALWLRHGCPVRVLYGDDGEMQCNNAMRHHGYLDFRRDAVDRLAAALEG